jgi:predicted 2-oxoglutarate/Fe(II)-dependent dioxygenase YbiX
VGDGAPRGDRPMALIGQAPGDVERGDRVLVSVQPSALAVAQARSFASDQPDEFMDGGEFLWGQHYGNGRVKLPPCEEVA